MKKLEELDVALNECIKKEEYYSAQTAPFGEGTNLKSDKKVSRMLPKEAGPIYEAMEKCEVERLRIGNEIDRLLHQTRKKRNYYS